MTLNFGKYLSFSKKHANEKGDTCLIQHTPELFSKNNFDYIYWDTIHKFHKIWNPVI